MGQKLRLPHRTAYSAFKKKKKKEHPPPPPPKPQPNPYKPQTNNKPTKQKQVARIAG